MLLRRQRQPEIGNMLQPLAGVNHGHVLLESMPLDGT
jgi:hypothetical protein